MTDLSRYNPTGRFTGLSDLYAKYRPSYPDKALDFIIERCGLDGTTTLVDVGCWAPAFRAGCSPPAASR